jgi:Protein of unknown function (DUF4242)
VALFLVERYLVGMSEESLRGALGRLGTATAGTAVRYLGSTIVLEDEACLCQFEAPSAADVAAVNRRAGVAFDRIVAALAVRP